jgi:dTMP kinase
VGEPDAGPAPEGGWIERFFGTRRFFALFNVQVISALGDWVGFFAITSLAASISSQPEGAIALVTMARVAPGFFLAPFIGVIVDRFDRKRLMITADVVRASVYLLLPLVQTVPGLILASFVLEVFTMVWSPAKEATVPAVVPADKLTSANSLSLVAAYATMPVAGPIQFALKSLNDRLVTVSFLGFLGLSSSLGDTQTLAFWFNAVSFLASAMILSRWVFHGLPSNAASSRLRAVPDAPVDQASEPESEGPVLPAPPLAAAPEPSEPEHPAGDPVEAEKSYLRHAWQDMREGWEFVFVNPVVRAVNIGLATGIVGGAMLVPLGPTFARYVIGDANTFPLFITALGVGVAIGVVLVSAVQRRLPKETVFPFLVMGAGLSLFLGVSMSTFWLAITGVMFLGLFAGSTYVLGFTLLQEHTEPDMRGRIFTTLLTLVRLCVLLALLMGPILATIFNGFARAATGDEEPLVPTASLFGFDLAIPGVRITLWLASAIIFGAGVLAARSMQMGIRSSFRAGWNDMRTGELWLHGGEPRAGGTPPEGRGDPGGEEEAS